MKTMKYKYWLLFLIIPILIVCQKLDITNPFDPDCPPEIWTPKSFNAELVSTHLEFEWEQPNNNISGFIIDRKIGAGEFEKVATLGKDILTWQDMNLVNGQLHTYQLYAYAGDNTSNMVTTSKTPIIKPELTTLVASEITYKSAKLNGEINPKGYETQVTFKYKKINATTWSEITLPDSYSGNNTQAVSVTVTNLESDTEYEYKVATTNELGTEESDIVKFKTKAVSLEIDYSEFNVSYKSGTAECTIETNVEDWEVSAGEWLTAIRNGDKINFSFTTNTSADERVYYVKVLAYGVEKIITFTQQGDEIVNIPDAVFKEYLLGETTINTNADNEIRLSEAEAFTGTIELFLLSISDLTGLEAFINITKFICTEIEARTYDLSANTKLTEIRIHEGSIDEIDISSCIELEVLRCWDTFMTEIDISNNIKLTSINFGSNSLVQLDLTQNTKLEEIKLDDNDITSLDLSNNNLLTSLDANLNNLSSITLPQNGILATLYLQHNQLSQVNTSTCTELLYFDCYDNQITSLDLTSNTKLITLDCDVNTLTSLDLSNNSSLTRLDCSSNQLTFLDVRNGNNSAINSFYADDNPGLSCINVSDVSYANTNWTNIDAGVSFNTDCSQSSTVTDIEGNVYITIKIGNQWWMAENLKSTKYADGTTIANITDNTVWANLDDNNTDKASCYYSLDYGYLYNYAAVTNGTPYDGTNNVQGVCPNGWHVPSDDEWKTLETYLGMSQTEADELGLRGTNEGGKLKETGTTHWNSPNTGATNESGFSALPGGYRKNSDGTNTDMGSLAVWWMPDEYSTNGAYYRSLSYDASTIYRQVGAKSSGASIRCVKD